MSQAIVGAYDFIILGLTLDLFGGLILAKGFIFKSIPSAVREAQTRFGGNSTMVRSLLLQRSEAILGGFLLASGFALQAWGNFHGGPAANELGWINSRFRLLAMLFTVAVFSAALWSVFRWWALRSFRHHFRGPNPWMTKHGERPSTAVKRGTDEAREARTS
jgi:hypothetical protein